MWSAGFAGDSQPDQLNGPHWVNFEYYTGTTRIPLGLEVDKDGNIYSLMTADSKASVSKFDRTGNVLWIKNFTNPSGGLTPTGLGISYSGDVYVVARAILPSGSGSNSCATIFKIDNTNGSIVWQKYLSGSGSSSYSAFKSIFVDKTGTIYAAGSIKSLSSTRQDAFITKWDASGNLLWKSAINVSSNFEILDIKVSKFGNIYCATTDAVNGFYALAVIKLNSSGSILWHKRLERNPLKLSVSNSIAVDNEENVYIGGYSWFLNNVDSGCLVKLDSSGALIWKRQIGTDSQSEIVFQNNVTLDLQDRPYIATSGGNASNFLILSKLGYDGSLTWANYFYVGYTVAGADNLQPGCAKVDQFNNLYTSGGRPGSPSALYVSKIPLDGTKTGTYPNTFGPPLKYSTSTITATDFTDISISNYTSNSFYEPTTHSVLEPSYSVATFTPNIEKDVL